MSTSSLSHGDQYYFGISVISISYEIHIKEGPLDGFPCDNSITCMCCDFRSLIHGADAAIPIKLLSYP
jgi:hypothetical protein